MQNFSPSANNKKGYVGLIQFSSGAAASLGTSQRDLKQMTFVEQMHYVEKYLSKKKDELNSMTDMYLQVLKPNAVGNGNNPDYVIFDESIPLPDGDGKNTSAAQRELNIQRDPWVKKLGYKSNPYFMVEEGEKKKREKWNYSNQKMELKEGFHGGKTAVWEVEQVLTNNHYLKGQANKFYGKCVDFLLNEIDALGRAPWMKIAILEGNNYKNDKESDMDLGNRIKLYHKLAGLGRNANPVNVPWCASFVSFCLHQSNISLPVNGRSRSQWFRTNNKDFRKINEIELSKGFIFGSLVVYTKYKNSGKGHVGFLVGTLEDDENSLIVLGGNQGGDKKGTQMITCLNLKDKSKTKFFNGFYLPKEYNI